MINKFYTDYPVVALGDKEGTVAPVRECEILEYDGYKYCRVSIEGHVVEVKRGYIYKSPGRIGEVSCVNASLLELYFNLNYYDDIELYDDEWDDGKVSDGVVDEEHEGGSNCDNECN